MILLPFYLLLAVLGLCCCACFFLVEESEGYSVVVVGRLLIAVASRCGAWAWGHVGFSSCGTWALSLQIPGSRAQAKQLWCMGLVALHHVGSSQIQDWTHVSCVSRRILYHWATRVVRDSHFFTGYTSFIVTIECWLCSLCCITYSYSLFST